jgi:hypothetical protein
MEWHLGRGMLMMILVEFSEWHLMAAAPIAKHLEMTAL